MPENPENFFDLELCEKLASGGMAEVFRAKQLGVGGFEKIVAVKRILPHFAADKEFRSMFQFEMNLAARLQHPNIAQIFKNGTAEDFVYLVMEYIDGKNLRELFDIARERNVEIPIPAACFVVAEAAKGLEYAHNFVDERTKERLGLIHRDISLQNIMVSYDGHVKIVDFGVAKASSIGSSTKAGVLKGKFSYMSPEQVRGEGIDHRSDIFSLGIVFFEILTRTRLFSRNDEMETLRAVNECQIPEASTLNSKIDPELEGILMKMLSRDRDLRFQSAKEVVKALAMYSNKKFPDFISMEIADFLKGAFASEIKRERSERERSSASGGSHSVSHMLGGSISQVRPPGSLSGSAAMPFYKSPLKLAVSFFALLFVIAVTATLVILFRKLNASSVSTAVIVSPKEIKGLDGWYAADSVDFESQGEGVGRWPDNSDRGFAALQEIEASRPSLVKAAVNGNAVLRFDGAHQFLESLDLAKDLRTTDELTVAYVAKPFSDRTHYVFAINEDEQDRTVVRAGFTDGKKLRLKATPGGSDYHDSEPVDIDQYSVYTTVFGKKLCYFYQDGYLRILVKLQDPVNYQPSFYFSIGQERDASGPSDFFHGDIAEMIVYRRALSGIERQALEIYLSKKYNIKIKAS